MEEKDKKKRTMKQLYYGDAERYWSRKILFAILMLIGIIVRIWEVGIIPGDINQDEAFAGFEAYSLLHYGMDSSAYPFPVYFTTWGSGMNALEIYLMMPFISLFGLNIYAIRMPQVIIACITLWVIFLLARKIFQSNVCFITLFLVAISPWHIMLSRWGLESNLAPAFLIFGLYFFVLGTENPRFYILSALFYGCSLYCYATIWLVVPVVLFFQILYCIWHKKIYCCKETIFSIFIIGVLASPLLLFLLINYGMIPEIKTLYFSIPKLVEMRSNEISLHDIGNNFKNICSIIFHQSDNYIVNSINHFGIFYNFSLPLFFLGLYCLICDIINSCKKRQFDSRIFIIINFVAAFLLGLLIQVNITKINSLFLPMIIILSYGLYKILIRFKKVFAVFLVVYGMSFVLFINYYFSNYKEEVKESFYYGSKEMLELTLDSNQKIYITKKLPYPIVLFYEKENVISYIETVQYSNYPSAFLDVDSFSNYSFNVDLENLDDSALYLLDDTYDITTFINAGYDIIHSDGIFYLAFKR